MTEWKYLSDEEVRDVISEWASEGDCSEMRTYYVEFNDIGFDKDAFVHALNFWDAVKAVAKFLVTRTTTKHYVSEIMDEHWRTRTEHHYETHNLTYTYIFGNHSPDRKKYFSNLGEFATIKEMGECIHLYSSGSSIKGIRES